MADYKTYDLGNNKAITWRRSIDDYYKGGLADFKDSQTVRFILDLCVDYLTKDEAIIESFKGSDDPAGVMDFIEAFADERSAVLALRKELETWLAERGLKL